MAREAEKLADVILVTDDNPRTEDPEVIVWDVLAGFAAPESVQVIHDRAEAIHSAIAQAGPDDLVLVAGKGHETYQEINGQRFPFSDAGHVCHELGLNGGVA